ncbi:MAG: alkaline phosphatase [Bacteroides sp.]|nr:alkaline phosphatase [Bacteroides sp.]
MKMLKKVLVAAALGLTVMAGRAEAPRYVFYYIGDGMGMGPVMAAQTYYRTVLGSEQPLTMLQLPVEGWCQTWSASSTTTDSAAAGTAIATGSKTRNGMLGMDADTTAVTSIATTLHEQGWGVGLVTSVAADDATPGAYYAHVANRAMHRDIDMQFAASGFEFLGGAGLYGLNGDHHGEIAEAFVTNGVQLLCGPESVDLMDSRRVCLLNTEKGHVWNLGYTVDSIQDRLDLVQLTTLCLGQLEKYTPERFFMMVEGGNIDHALHGNDGGAAVMEIINFDKALDVAMEFYRQHPDETLIVVTADHDTGGLAMGNNTVKYSSHFDYLQHQRKSKEVFSEECKAMLRDRRVYTWDDMRAKLEADFGLFNAIPVSEAEEQKLKDMFVSTFEKRNSEDQKTLYASFDAFSVAVLHLVNEKAGYGFTSTSHTGNVVPLFAVGVGADRFKGLNNNNEITPTVLDIINGK